jgi:cupin 2 domain-containing protein
LKKSLLADIPENLPEEMLQTICSGNNVNIERIISRGHSSPPGFWYDQEKNEFVLVLQGKAGLRLEGKKDVLLLEPGDYLDIPARVKHRVEWTDPRQDTVWLAVHY